MHHPRLSSGLLHEIMKHVPAYARECESISSPAFLEPSHHLAAPRATDSHRLVPFPTSATSLPSLQQHSCRAADTTSARPGTASREDARKQEHSISPTMRRATRHDRYVRG